MQERRSDIRFNTRELIGLFVLLVVVSSLIFGLGVYVGKGMSETKALLFLKEQLANQQMTPRPISTGSHEVGSVPEEEPMNLPESGEEGEVPPDDLSKADPQSVEPTPSIGSVSPSKVTKTFGVNREEIKSALFNDEAVQIKGLPYKSKMAKECNKNAPTYSILLKTSPEIAEAEQMAKNLQAAIDGVFVDISPNSPIDSTPSYRVLIGRYHSMAQAQTIARSLHLTKKIDAFTIEKIE